MSNFKVLVENLFQDDLKNMVHPLVSIDDFESKIDENTMVIAFYVKNENAAEDLSVFIERSRFDFILDTEVSLISNKDGDYLVFIEMDINDKSGQVVTDQIVDIIRITTILTGTKKWNFKNNRILNTKVHSATENNIKLLLKKIKESQ